MAKVPPQEQKQVCVRLPYSVHRDLLRAIKRDGYKSLQAWFDRKARQAIE